MTITPLIQDALANVWHQDAAKNSLERWLDLLKQESWEMSDEELALMTRLFGASWYFTRFVYFRGADIIPLFKKEKLQVSHVENELLKLHAFIPADSLEAEIEKLRIKKNEVMLSILLLQLDKIIDQEHAELLLTRLADAVLSVMYRLFELDKIENTQCIVLAMGRFAGNEMNYGSDLDLIFIEKVLNKNNFEQIVLKIRKLLRCIAIMDPSGALYEIDMRLRPHGSSGTLVTPLDSFLEFHKGEREIWERQMMTRCRFVTGNAELSSEVERKIVDNIYRKYDLAFLAKEILKVRLLVEQELAGGKDKLELKRGKGGIMDIDFLTHFLQLAYGHEYKQLRSASTRQVLRAASDLGLLHKRTAASLLNAYDFYKQSESALRVFDMKTISKVSKNRKEMLPLARALGYMDYDSEQAVEKYQNELKRLRNQVREQFENVLNEAF